MKKYRIIFYKEKYRLQVKYKGFFGRGRWKELDYFFSLESAERKFDEVVNSTQMGIIKESEWI